MATTFDELPIGAHFLCDRGLAYRKVALTPGCNAFSADGVPCAFSPNYPVSELRGRLTDAERDHLRQSLASSPVAP